MKNISIKKFKRFIFLIIKIPFHQLLARLVLTFKREFLTFYMGVNNPKKFFTFPYPKKLNKDFPKSDILQIPKGNESIPFKVNLVGTKYVIHSNINWHDPRLDIDTRLEKLNLHYMNYLKSLNNNSSINIILNWIKNVNPYTKDYWKYSWNSYSLSIRVVNWIDFVSTLENFKFNEELEVIHESIINQINFLSNNIEFDIRGNHIIKNIRCLLRGASYFDIKESNKWIKVGCKLLEIELENQILKDGMHFELSPSYHLQVTEDLMCTRRSLIYLSRKLKKNKTFLGIINKLDNYLLRMTKVIDYLTHPDGYISLFGDGGLNMASPPICIIKKLREEGVLKKNFKSFDQGSWVLKESGYFGFKKSSSLFIVDCGPVCANNLPAHGQGDALSFEWSVEGRRVVVDPGTYEYHAGERRNYSRATSSHNTLNINDLDQSEFWSSFRIGRRSKTKVINYELSKNYLKISAYNDGYKILKGNPMHFRNIFVSETELRVKDRVKGGISQKAKSIILFAPDIRIIKNIKIYENNFSILFEIPPNKKYPYPVKMKLESTLPMTLKEAEYYPDFGICLKSKKVVLNLGTIPSVVEWSIKKI